jgi:divalent metal cation (Fe/Co/Zn/Cd) transporter
MAMPSQPPNPITQLPDFPITQLAAAGRGRRLEYFTIAWNSAEAIASLAAGLLAGSIVLVGFGLDSVIEVSSGAVLLWRLHAESDPHRRERAEHRALRLVGACFLVLAAYVAFDAIRGLVQREVPQPSLFGIGVAIASLIAMPLLARAKRQVARQLNSGAMHADSRQTDFCFYLSAILLAGLVLNGLLGWWWADPVAALVMVPLIAREGAEGLRGERCCD